MSPPLALDTLTSLAPYTFDPPPPSPEPLRVPPAPRWHRAEAKRRAERLATRQAANARREAWYLTWVRPEPPKRRDYTHTYYEAKKAKIRDSIREILELRDGPAREWINLPRPRPSIPDLPDPVAVAKPTGIDLKNRSHEVKKLLFAGFGRRIFAAGYDPDDVLQEVFRGLLARNRGSCPWDETRSSFGHYCHMVIGCVLSNYHRKEQRRKRFEQTGVRVHAWDQGDSDGYLDVDAADCNRAGPEGLASLPALTADLAAFVGSDEAGKAALACLPGLLAGESTKEIGASTGLGYSAIRRTRLIRERAAEWAAL